MRLNGPGHLVRTQATGAGVNPLRGTVHNSLDTFNIRLPGAVRTSVGVGYLDAESHTLSADIAFCHNHLHLLFKAIRFFQGMNRPRPTSLKKNNGYILADPARKSKLFFHFNKKIPVSHPGRRVCGGQNLLQSGSPAFIIRSTADMLLKESGPPG